MRYLNARDLFVLYGLEMVPALFPLLLLLSLLVRPSRKKLAYTLLYFGYNFGIFLHFNHRYLKDASPLRTAWWVPIIQVIFPIQLLLALCSPQRINWRGHVIHIEKGGQFRFERRQTEE
jgi:ceramide glucosyltransferase